MNKNEIYKCNICGNIVEVLTVGGGDLVCCGEMMKKLEEKTADVTTEKHVPAIEGNVVKVGKNSAHPMEEKHYIEWIEVSNDGKFCKQFLKPGDKPEAEFADIKDKKVIAREHCNIHGLWKG